MRYSNYSVVDSLWVEELPSDWQFNHLRTVFWERKESNDPIKIRDILSLSAKHGVQLYGDKTHEGGNRAKDDLSKYHIAYPGDLIVNCMNVISGSVGLSNYKGLISPVYYALVTRDEQYNRHYYSYLFSIEPFQKSLLPLGKGILMHESGTGKLNTIRLRIAMSSLNNVSLPVPPREEQDQIVRYLDWQVSKINKLIHGYQREIKLLEEKLKSKITYMVTHDRYSDERKKSEIYWLLDVPVDWRVTKLKHILVKQDRPVRPDAELLICANSGEVKLRGDAKIGLVADNDDIYQGVAKGDLLIHGMDTWHGAIAISHYDGMCTPVVHVCTSYQSLRFICYYLRMMSFSKIFKAISNGVRQNTSDFRSWDKAGSLLIALPSVDEQEAISDILDNEAKKTKEAISSLQKQIELMREYRTRLISDVVTGQIDVRGIEIPDYTPETDAEDEPNDVEISDEEATENE